MWISRTTVELALLASLALSGCSMHMKAQEVALQIDPVSDSAQLLVVYRGVSASGPGELENALSNARAVLDGEPLLWIPDWHVHVNFDALPQQVRDPAREVTPLYLEAIAKIQEFARRAELLEADAFVADGELCSYQRFRFSGVSLLIAAANDAIDLDLLESRARGKSDALVDARTNELWQQRAAERTPWIRLEDGELVVEIPCSRAFFEQFRAEPLIDDVASDLGGAAWLGRHLAYLTRFTYEHELVTLRFAPLANGLYLFAKQDESPEPYDAALKDALEREGRRLRDDIDIEALKANFADEVGIRQEEL